MPVQSGLPTLSASSRSSRSSYEHDLRRRRVQDDSSANSATHVAPHSQVTLQGYTQQKFRAGCPPLHILPLQSIIVPYDHESSVALRGLLPGIRNALKSHQVQPEDECDPICLVYRPIPDELPTVENITVYVQAIWDDNSPLQWLNAVKAIQAILQSHPGTSNIKVEIISWQLTAPRNIEALEESHPLVAAWPQIRPQVHVILGQSPVVATSWLTILVLRQGYNPPGSWLGGPYSTSVVLRIIMSYDVDPWQWIEQEHNIKELLIQRGFADIDVEFERGENVRMVFPLSEPRDTPKSGDIIDGPYNVSVGMGADFGPARNLFQAPEKPVAGPCGTIGGYLTVTGPNGTSRKMGLTNHHVIREVFEGFIYTTAPDGQAIKGEILGNSVLTWIDQQGMAPESVDTADKLLEAPSRRKHNYTMQDLAGCIRDLQNTLGPLSNPKHVKEVQARLAALQHQYDEKKRFFDEGKHILGRPWMSSGFKRRTIDNGRLDWALINFEDNRRIGSNQIPPASQWPDPDRAPLESGNILNGIAPIKDPQARTTVFKVGARTGPTRGKYSHIKPDVRMPDDDRLGMPDSSEHSFVYSGSQEQLFGIRGDSGAFVFTLDGKLIGVLFGGPVSETLKPGLVTYVTGAEELLKDIQAQFKGIYKIELSPD